jgi:hypothetical protein
MARFWPAGRDPGGLRRPRIRDGDPVRQVEGTADPIWL